MRSDRTQLNALLELLLARHLTGDQLKALLEDALELAAGGRAMGHAHATECEQALLEDPVLAARFKDETILALTEERDIAKMREREAAVRFENASRAYREVACGCRDLSILLDDLRKVMVEKHELSPWEATGVANIVGG